MFTGAGRRRRWSDEDKARIVAEIVASGDSVCSVARRHGLSPRQLFGSPRQLRKAANDHSEAEEVQFVPACQSAFKFWTPNDNPHHASASGDARQRSWGTGDDDARRQNDKPCRSGCQDFDKDHELEELDASLNPDIGHNGHGRFEQFLPVGRSGAASESSWGMLGKAWLEIGSQWVLHTHALIAASNALVPTIFMTRVRL